ncbi:MAG: low molecular weight phosphotyrosine protein phosphatase [Proteobacteria bacterium]|nr:low molecular weight phosphotyrosine protein phosphatase [Pseudomonadota bacterium]MDA1058350.1 low molecular weight phosphotyrosine protein phosphatase [Pseudomonadota bacterium]
MVQVLFVCLGNICRSPMAEGVFRHLVADAGLAAQIAADSAGTGAWHVGQPPDERAQAITAQRGIDIAMQRARQVAPMDFSTFDYVLAMDGDNLRTLMGAAPTAARTRIRLILDYGDTNATDVPDPYYGGPAGFDQVFDLVHDAAVGLLRHIRKNDL